MRWEERCGRDKHPSSKGSGPVARVLHDADQPYQMWALPASTKGTVWVRATDVGSADTSLETLSVDEMFILSGVAWPAVSIAAAGGAESGWPPAVFTVTRTGDTATSCKSGSGFAAKTWLNPITTFRKVRE